MIFKRNKILLLWVLLLFFYLFIKFTDRLDIPLISISNQNKLLTVVYLIGALLILFSKKVNLSKVTLFGILFMLTSVISSLLFLNSGIFTIVSLSFWLIIFILCNNVLSTNEKEHLNVYLKVALVVNIVYLLFKLDYLVGANVNAIYYVVLLLPVIFLFEKKYIRIILFAISCFLIICSAKRTAFIILFLVITLPNLLAYKYLSNSKKIISIFLFALLSFALFYFYNDILNYLNGLKVWNRFLMLSEDGGSGRFDIYTSVFNEIKNSNLFNFLIGHGFGGVFANHVSSTSAHNDFLEILYDYGFIGFILYLLFIINLFNSIYFNARKSVVKYKVFIASLIIFIVMSLFSHLIIYPTYFFYLIIMFCLCDNNVCVDVE